MNLKLLALLFTLIPLLRAEAIDVDSLPKAKCNESRFKPVICAKDVPEDIKYRPSFGKCGGNAAALLDGDWASSYSIVLRDKENRDRVPPCTSTGTNFNGCSYYQCNDLALKSCSAFKCQKVIKTKVRGKSRTICCFGGTGTSKVLSGATRMTIKLADDPGSHNDPLVRVALNKYSPKRKLN